MDKLLSDPYEHLFHFRRLYVNPVKYSSFSELLCSDLSVHLSSNFRELCLCISDDVYEWNHGLFVFLCWLRSYSELDSLCSPLELSCSDLLLSLDCLRDEGISSLRVSFSRLLFSMSTLVFRVNDLSLLDRYDLLVRVSSDKYRASTDLLTYEQNYDQNKRTKHRSHELTLDLNCKTHQKILHANYPRNKNTCEVHPRYTDSENEPQEQPKLTPQKQHYCDN